MLVVDNQEFPLLFSHSKRAEWGVGVLSGRGEGRCSYLFEDGEERMLGAQGMQLLRKVERPTREQQATWTHLLTLLAKRRRAAEPSVLSAAAAIDAQIERFREKFSAGFFGAAWNERSPSTARQARQAVVPRAQELFSAPRVARLIADERIAEVWQGAATLLAESGMAVGSVPSPRGAEEQRQLAQALVDLLYGTQSYERRFERWVTVYASVASDGPTWQTATALPALLAPLEHVYVESSSFRRQLTSLARPANLGGRPSGAAYLRCLGAAQSLAHLLAVRGAIPQDLLDVHDFVRTTLGSAKSGAKS